MPIFAAARDLAGLSPIGTHQFIVIEPKQRPFPVFRRNGRVITARGLGAGRFGFVIGAQNRVTLRGRVLKMEFFERSDHEATREIFDPERRHPLVPDFSGVAREVEFAGDASEAAKIREVFWLVSNYAYNVETDPIRYPTAGLGYNSNSWVGSVIAHAGGCVNNNFPGFDVGHNHRIPRTYFIPECTPAGRRQDPNRGGLRTHSFT